MIPEPRGPRGEVIGDAAALGPLDHRALRPARCRSMARCRARRSSSSDGFIPTKSWNGRVISSNRRASGASVIVVLGEPGEVVGALERHPAGQRRLRAGRSAPAARRGTRSPRARAATSGRPQARMSTGVAADVERQLPERLDGVDDQELAALPGSRGRAARGRRCSRGRTGSARRRRTAPAGRPAARAAAPRPASLRRCTGTSSSVTPRSPRRIQG